MFQIKPDTSLSLTSYWPTLMLSAFSIFKKEEKADGLLNLQNILKFFKSIALLITIASKSTF